LTSFLGSGYDFEMSNRYPMKVLLMSILLLTLSNLYSQSGRGTSLKAFLEYNLNLSNKRYYFSDSSHGKIYLLVFGNCRFQTLDSIQQQLILTSTGNTAAIFPASSEKKKQLVKITGSITYEFYYNDRIDTPLNARGYKQHTETVGLKVMLKDKYPLNIAFTARQTNNNEFRDYFNPSIHFDRSEFNRSQVNEYVKRWDEHSLYKPLINDLGKKLRSLETGQVKLRQETAAGKWPQKIVTEREEFLKYRAGYKKAYQGKGLDTLFDGEENAELNIRLKKIFRSLPDLSSRNSTPGHIPLWIDSLNIDSIEGLPETPTERFLKANQQKLADIQFKHVRLNQLKDSLELLEKTEFKNFKASIVNNGKRKQYLKQYGRNNKVDRFLSDIKSFGLGRTSVNYSELTIKNIFLSGVQMEYDPGKYYAVAAGRIDYRFRDFYNVQNLPEQYFAIVRYGSSYNNQKGVIASFFYGQKTTFGTNENISRFTGYSIESFFNWDRDNKIRLELAKTTPAIAANGKPGLFSFSNDNLAVSAKVNLLHKKTLSSFEGFYRTIGHDFQSMHLFTGKINQTAWHLKVQQELFRKSTRITMMLRQNDFSNEGQVQNFSTKTLLKSIQVSYRKSKRPFFNFGYYPGSQLIKTDSGIVENLHYLVNITAGYTYFPGKWNLQSVLNYNRFINKSTDTGFVKFNGYTILLNNSITAKNLSFQFSGGYTSQVTTKYSSIETGIDYDWKRFLSIGAGIKFNRTTSGNSFYGGRANITLVLGKVGSMQVYYDRIFIPEMNNNLIGTDIGKITWTKNF
jgi:hypothetical protein